MTRHAWIGLDVGTTSSKAVAYDRTGAVLAEGRAPTHWERSAAGVSTDPDELLAGALAALGQATERLPDGVEVAGVGVASMGEVGVLVDRRGTVLAPAIAWHDTRDQLEVASLERDIGADRFGMRAGKPLRGQFSLTKHRWLTAQVDGARDAVRRFNVAEWVVRSLTGAEVCDRSLACRTGWYDISANDWWDDALAWSGASRDLMPELIDAGTEAGRIRTGPARLLGAVVTTAGHDHQAAALGAGAAEVGDELDSSGTAEAIVRTVAPDLSPAQLLTLARGGITTDVSIQPGRWSLLGGTEGGLAMQQTLDGLGVGREDLPGLDRMALDPGDRSSRVETWRAAVLTATAQAKALHDSMTAVAGPHRRLVAAGGWCRSEMVMHAKREAFGALEVSREAEAGALGAATLAARASGDLNHTEALGDHETRGGHETLGGNETRGGYR